MNGLFRVNEIVEADRERENAAESAAQIRALRIADEASISLIESEGERFHAMDHYVFTADDIATSEILADAIAHLLWRDLATRLETDNEVTVILHDY